MKVVLQKTENYHMQDNNKEMPKADEPLYFTIDEKQNSIELTDKGIDLITNEGEDPHFFILPDLSTSLAKVEKDMSMNAEQKFEKKEVNLFASLGGLFRLLSWHKPSPLGRVVQHPLCGYQTLRIKHL